jgi:long-chain acyl-CoA synthetase
LVGSVGEPLPGVEVRIIHPNDQGIGEVIARGPNVMAGYYENKEATDATIIDGWLHTGDLGTIDEAGNLFLVGRSKDLIVGPSGKNVYPDELEELYRHNDYIKELSIVGLPDEDGERIACLVVPDYEFEESLSRSQVHSRIEEHFRDISSALPVYKRVQWSQFYDDDLPRTGTRKVKRREVISILQKRIVETTPVRVAASDSSRNEWLTEIVSQVSGKPVSTIQKTTTFDELGFDSLMYNELGAAIEASGRKIPSLSGLTAVTNIQSLAEFLSAGTRAVLSTERASKQLKKKEDEIEFPAIIQEAGSLGLDIIQKIFYRKVMDVEIQGKSNIPAHTNFIVAPNHCSHLDMGLVKTAMDEAGKNLVAVAAADYFFDNKYKKAFFENFTNLIPMERKGSLRESLQMAHNHLHHGYNLLIFPEGTRSPTGAIQEFKSSLGYLALRTGKGILPVYLDGTFEAMPKGSSYIKSRQLGVRFGPFLSYELLEKLTRGLPKNDAYRLITAVAQRIVQRMKDGLDPAVDLNAIRRQWSREQHHPQIEAAPVTGD